MLDRLYSPMWVTYHSLVRLLCHGWLQLQLHLGLQQQGEVLLPEGMDRGLRDKKRHDHQMPQIRLRTRNRLLRVEGNKPPLTLHHRWGLTVVGLCGLIISSTSLPSPVASWLVIGAILATWFAIMSLFSP